MGNNPSDFSHWLDENDHMDEAAKTRLRDAIDRRNTSMKAVSIDAGVGETFVRDILERERDPGVSKLAKVASVLGITVSDIVYGEKMGNTVPLVGVIETGAVVSFFSGADSLSEMRCVPSPPDAPYKTVAVEVQGDSMLGLADNGWLLYYQDLEELPKDNLIGKLCVLWLTDGRVVVRKLFDARTPERWNLYTANSGQLERDVEVVRAAPVIWIRPS